MSVKQFIKTILSTNRLVWKSSCILIFMLAYTVSAQDSLNITREIQNAKKHSVMYRYGNYIPYDILDAIRVIGVTSDSATLKRFEKRNLEEVYLYGIDSSITGIRRDWALEGNSHLAKYFNNLGIYYHKTMKLLISKCYHDHLNNKEIILKKNIRWSKSKYRKEEREARKRTNELQRIISKDQKDIYKYEDQEKKHAYDEHNSFYKDRDRKLKKLEKKRIKQLKNGELINQ